MQMSAPFYRAFEDKYRGSRELIKSRLEAYHPFLSPLRELHARPQALDIGCGRGEWLELLGEQGFAARGIDLDDSMLQACRERGLDVALSDGLAALRETPSSSLALVSAFHVVEHIVFEDLQAMVVEALRVLLPGGILVLETPNPENLEVGTSSFYLDPSHIKPLPPQLLAFVADHAGFERKTILRLQEADELHDESSISLMAVLTGVSPDYAVVAQKHAATDVLRLHDAAFSKQYGLSLSMLAQRYDDRYALAEQRQAHVEQGQARAEQLYLQAETRLNEAAAAATSSEQQLRRLVAACESRVRQAKTSIAVLEARVALLEQQGLQTQAQLDRFDALRSASGASFIGRLHAIKMFLRHPRPGPVVRLVSKIARKLGVHGPLRAVYLRLRNMVLTRLRPPTPSPERTPGSSVIPLSSELSDDAQSVWNQLHTLSHSKNKKGVD